MTVRARSLRTTPLFSGISDRVLLDFARSGWFRSVGKGEVLFRETDRADAVYIVHSGCINIYLATPDGRELVINEMHPGDCFGELAFITGRRRSTGAMAREASEVIIIAGDVFMEGIKAEPELLRRILETTAQRLRVSSERESALAFLSSQGRIARVLLMLNRQTKADGVVEITQQKLAQHVGLARQTVSRTLGEWREKGWVGTSRGRIMLTNHAALQEQSEEIEPST